MPTDSGRPHHIFRCPQCQTAVWSEYGGLARLRFVRVGTLDDPAALPPDIHIFTRSKLPWVTLPSRHSGGSTPITMPGSCGPPPASSAAARPWADDTCDAESKLGPERDER